MNYKKIQLLIIGFTVFLLAIKDYFKLQHCNLLVFAYAFGGVS